MQKINAVSYGFQLYCRLIKIIFLKALLGNNLTDLFCNMIL